MATIKSNHPDAENKAARSPSLVRDKGVQGCMDHCFVVDPGEGAVLEFDFVVRENGGPDDAYLKLGKTEANASMTARTKWNPFELSALGIGFSLGHRAVRPWLRRLGVALDETVRLELAGIRPLGLQTAIYTRGHAKLPSLGNHELLALRFDLYGLRERL